MAKKKATPTDAPADKAPRRPRARDWPKLKVQWYESNLSARAFCAQYGIPYATAKPYLRIADKKKWRADQIEADLEAKKKLAAMGTTEIDPQLLLKTLKETHGLARDVMLTAYSACKRFQERPPRYGGFSGAGEAARVTILASERMEQVATQLQGIPDLGSEEGWLLSRGFRPQWYQRDFVFDLASDTGAFLFVFHGGIGSGKTKCGAEKFGEIAWMNRGIPHIIAAPTYRMLEDATKPMFFDVIQEKGLSHTYLKQDNKIVLFGDTPILFRSMEKADHLRGPNVAAVWIDEGGQMRDDQAFKILEGRCRHAHAKERCILITTTPNGLTWLYDTIEDLRAKGLVRTYGAKTQDNRYLPKDYVTIVEASFDERYAKQELGGEFLNIFTGQAYWAFARMDHVLPAKKVPYIKGLPLLLCCDFNVAPLCWNVCQEIQGVLYCIDELHIQGAATELAAREFKTRWGEHKAGVDIHGDASGWYKSTSATSTDYAVLEAVLADAPAIPAVTLHAGRSNPEVKSRIASMNARLRDMRNHRKFFISEDCTHTIRDFERVCFKPGTQELDKSNPELTHHTDAIGYLIEQKWPIHALKGRYA